MKKYYKILTLMLALVLGLTLSSCGGTENSTTTSGSTTSGSTDSSSSSSVAAKLAGGDTGAWYYYDALPKSEQQKVLALLEKDALSNFAGGIPLYSNSAFVMYSDRVQLFSNEYIPQLGFGTAKSSLNGVLDGDQIQDQYKDYFYDWESASPSTFNQYNAQGSVTSDMAVLTNAVFFTTDFTADKKWFEFKPELATALPLNENGGTEASKVWKFQVRDDAKWATKVAENEQYNNTPITMEDVEFTFKALLTKEYNYYRSTEIGDSDFPVINAQKYYNGEVSWDEVGIKVDDATRTLTITLDTPKTQEDMIYALGDTITSPINKAFFEQVGAEKYASSPETSLSSGVYTLDHHEEGKEIVFSKNNLYFDSVSYKFAGRHYAILKDSEEAFKQFISGNLDSASVPASKYDQFKNDQRIKKIPGSTVFRLGVNMNTAAGQKEMFPNSKWDIKPIMSQKDFITGLYFATDRATIGSSIVPGKDPALAYFSDAYYADTSAHESYRSSAEGKSVEALYSPDTAGYNLGAAKAYFRSAIDAALAAGDYASGDTINVSLFLMDGADQKTLGEFLKAQWQDAFNTCALDGGKYKNMTLVINFTQATVWSDVYYQAQMVGDFDISFGGISGSTLDPLGFAECFRSDNKSGFTLDWGFDSSQPTIEYNGEIYSYDALDSANNGGAFIKDGVETDIMEVGKVTPTANAAAFNIHELMAVNVDTIQLLELDADGNAVATTDVTADYKNLGDLNITGLKAETSYKFVVKYSFTQDGVDFNLSKVVSFTTAK